MTNRANIYYDYEIEELVRTRSVGLLPMITYMFAQYPQGTLEDIFYTIELHVIEHGVETYPEFLLSAPAPAYEPVVEEVPELVEEKEEPAAPAEVEVIEEAKDDKAPAERRNIQRRAVEEKPHEKLNVRGIMDDLKGLDL